jgi:thiamine-monophosphate kinase
VTRIPLGAGPEFDRIRAIAEALGESAGALGDDCASVPDAEGTLVLSTDASIENVHFRRDWMAAEEIGWRAAAAALSDLAAQGATPVGLLAAVALPREAPVEDSTGIMRGIGRAAADSGAAVLGGDLSAAGEWMITVTVVGRAVRPVSRRGASPGDGLWVTGALGAARAALDAWRAGREPAPGAREAFAHPRPRIAAGRWLGEHGARAMLDLSDGLAADAGHLAAASGCRAEIDLDSVPTAGDAVVGPLAAGRHRAAAVRGGGRGGLRAAGDTPGGVRRGGPAPLRAGQRARHHPRGPDGPRRGHPLHPARRAGDAGRFRSLPLESAFLQLRIP